MDLKNPEYNQALFCIDIFTKVVAVEPLKSKQANDVYEACLKIVKKDGWITTCYRFRQ